MNQLNWNVTGEQLAFSDGTRWREWVAATARGELAFLVLEEDESIRGFVQCAGTSDEGLIAELRVNTPGQVSHLRFVRPGVDPSARFAPRVPGYLGDRVANVLSVDEVNAIFEHYERTREPWPLLEVEDILHELGG